MYFKIGTPHMSTLVSFLFFTYFLSPFTEVSEANDVITFRLSPASEKKALSPSISLRKKQEDVSHPRKSPTRGKYHVIFNGFLSTC